MIEEVISFAREYINKPAYRTAERKAKIREALKQLTGEIVLISCGTCYIEALYKILKRTTMATSKYELRRGVVLQVFGDPTKTCTNNTLTDALAEWYLEHYPEKAIYFIRRPAPEAPIIPAGIKIIPPAPKVEIIIPEEEPKSDFQPMTVMENALNNISKAHIEAEKKSDIIINKSAKKTPAKRISKKKT